MPLTRPVFGRSDTPVTQRAKNMATITKRGTSWFAQIRRKGFAARYKSFATKGEAQTWARQQEALIDSGEGVSGIAPHRKLTLSELLSRYMDEVSPRKRGAASEIARLKKMQRSPMCQLGVQGLTPAAVAAYREQRLSSAKPGTVRRELATLRHALDVARREWGAILTHNPARLVALPIAHDARDRRLNPGELEKLLAALASTRNVEVQPIVLLAIETGLRRGELLGLHWQHISLTNRTAHIPHTKTGVARTIPLTDAAVDILGSLSCKDGFVFAISANGFRQAWERLRKRAGLADLRFHDLRHEAVSRFCELGLSIPEIAVISGHRDPRMLLRYSHIRADDLAKRLAGRRWRGAPALPANEQNDV